MRFPHPDYLLPYLTSEQFEEWAAYYELQPWGDERDDQRMEAWRQRFLVALFGPDAGDRNTKAFFPYFTQPVSADQVLAEMRATEERLRWDGTRYVWMN